MNKIAIIDCDSIIFSAFHPNKVLDSEGNPLRENNKFVYKEKTEEEILKATDIIMNNILSNGKFTHYIGFVKGKNTTSERLHCNSSYKANRPLESPKFWKFTKNYLIEKWKAVEVDNIEVDDAVNIARLNIKDSYIVAIDGDLLGLEGIHYNWRKDEWISVTEEEAEYKFWSDMICGQPGDNLPGLKGKGPKFVQSLFDPENLISKYHLVFGAYIDHYKDIDKALTEYYKTYKCLKIKDNYKDFYIPELIEYKNFVKEFE